ncbi:MAG: hypothetical protein ABJL54_00210 [Halioglobus sp.]
MNSNGLLSVCILLLCFFLSPARASGYTLSGVVYGNNAPLTQVTLELRSTGDGILIADAVTDVSGRYALPVEDGEYYLNAIPEPDSLFAVSKNNAIQIASSDKLQDIYLTELPPIVPDPGTLVGSVYLFEGVPLPATDALIYVGTAYDPAGSGTPDIFEASLVGQSYSIDLPQGTYAAGVEYSQFEYGGLAHAGYYSTAKRSFPMANDLTRPLLRDVVIDGDVTLDITMPEYIVIRGRVVDSEGLGIAGVQVSASHESGAGAPVYINYTSVSVITNELGDYAMAVFADSSYQISLNAPEESSYTSESYIGVELSEFSSEHNYTLSGTMEVEFPGSVGGSVYLSDGAPLPAQDVLIYVGTAYDPAGSGTPDIFEASLVGQSYSIDLPQGTYAAGVEYSQFEYGGVAHAGYYSTAKRSFPMANDLTRPLLRDVVIDGDVPLDITMPEYIVISGRVVDSEGLGIAGVLVSASHESGSGAPINIDYTSVMVTTDESGGYEIAVFSDVNYRVNLEPAHGSVLDPVALTGVNFSVPKMVNFTIATSTLPSDRDGDGVPDSEDAFPDDPSESVDSDGDGVGDNADQFPQDPTRSKDSDGDGVEDSLDEFPNDSSEWQDTDGDGVGDNGDAYPYDPDRSSPEQDEDSVNSDSSGLSLPIIKAILDERSE